MAYGTMGGEGQPQTQAMIFSRLRPLRPTSPASRHRPALAVGKNLGGGNHEPENRVPSRLEQVIDAARRQVGHQVELVGPFEEFMGHAGALVHHPGGLIEGASDPRSDGTVATC